METNEKSNSIAQTSKKSVKWSFLGELFSKIATPLSTLVLAHLLLPEIYSIATAVTIVVSFCENVAESGFASFIIQHNFEEKDYDSYFSVAFFSSIILSLVLCVFVIIFKSPLSGYIGNQGYENVLAVSCLQIPFYSASAIFAADLKKNFDFKRLFVIRILVALVPFVITIPLALLGFNYWSLVIGTIASPIIQLPFLIRFSRGKLKFKYSFSILKDMFSFSFLLIIEAVLVWGCTWVGTIIAINMPWSNESIAGVIKVSNSTVTSIFALFGSAYISVLFPALSKLTGEKKNFADLFLDLQSSALFLLIPMGVGVYFYCDLFTNIFLGNAWIKEGASFVIAVYALCEPIHYCFNNFLSTLFKAKGHIKESIVYQIVSLAVDVCFKLTVGKFGFEIFVWTNLFKAIIMSTIVVIVLKLKYKISILKQLSSLMYPLIGTVAMLPIILLGINLPHNLYSTLGQILVCAAIYFGVMYLIKPKLVQNSLSYFFNKG